MSSKDTDVYMKKVRSRGSKVGTVMEKIAQDRLSELDKLRIQAEIDEVKAKMAKSQAEARQALQGNQGYGKPNSLHSLFVGRSPEEIDQIIEKLTPEKIKILHLINADPTQQATLTQLLGTQTPGKEQSVNDTIQLIKLVTDMNRPNQGITLQGMAALIKSVKGEEKGSSMKDTIAILKPIYDTINQQNTQILQDRIKTLETQSRNNPTLVEQLKQTKDLASLIGLSSTAKNPEFDLKLEEMRQSHDMDMQRITWEQKKYLLQQQAETDKWERVQETFAPILQMASPEIRNAIRKAGEGVGKSLGGASNPQGPKSEPQTASFICPECNATLNVPIPPGTTGEINVKCPKCGKITPTNVAGAPTTEQQQAPPPEKSPGRLTYKSA